MDRLRESAQNMRIPFSYSDKEIANVILKLANCHDNNKEVTSTRITLTRGVGNRGLLPPSRIETDSTVIITVSSNSQVPQKSIGLIYSSITCDEGSLSAGIKTLAYTDNILAKMEAKDQGAHDAIILNTQGKIVSATASNIFVISEDREILTPSSDSGILQGVIRQLIFDICLENELSIEEKEILPEELVGKDLFLTNSLMGIQSAYLISDGYRESSNLELLDQLKGYYAEKIFRNFSTW